MHELANEIIEKRNGDIIDTYSYEDQIKINPKGCPHYKQNTKCHDVEDLNCYFCFCPKYDRSIKEGACKINSPEGKYIDKHEGKIWDCSDCTFPHKRENPIKLLANLFK